MAKLKVKAVTHWSIPVNDLEEAEKFYGEVLGLEHKGRLANSTMSCFTVGGHSILLCRRKEPLVRTPEQDSRLHHAFEVTPEEFEKGYKLFREKGVTIAEPIVYRERGFFTGRELYFLDPSGNMLELRDATWKPGMPMPPYEGITGS
ncbi:MAG: VOC family protein [Candidatus Binatia bacterium]|jgi:extradiol dioxygenase family protein|nr:VOC family protein [Candidatus Binatia bacterium]